MNSFDGKKIFVTGGAKGIGLEISKAFAAAGANVAINDLVPPEIELHEHNIKSFYQFDISKADEVNHNINKLLEESGGIDILVNNAGITRDSFFIRMSEENWDDVINANLKGTFNVTKAP